MISKNQIKQVTALHIKKYRDNANLFIAEGTKIGDEIIENKPELITELFLTKGYLESQTDRIVKQKLKFTVVSEEELKKISMLAAPNKVLAVCHYFKDVETDIDLSKNFSLYLDDIRDPGNLGTILRIADWFGISQIFCSPHSTDLYNPKTIQSAMGAFLRVKVRYIDLNELAQKPDTIVYGTVLNGKNIYHEKLRHGLIIIGNESAGIDEAHLKFVTNPLTIPAASSNKTESLNAAMASAIVCAEFFRQLN